MTQITRAPQPDAYSGQMRTNLPLKRMSLNRNDIRSIECNVLGRIWRGTSPSQPAKATEMRVVSSLPGAGWEKASSVGTGVLIGRKTFTIRPIARDGNNGLRAIVVALNPDVDPKVEGVVSGMLRGDLILHMKHHLIAYAKFFEEDNLKDQGHLNETLMTHCERMINSEERIGMLELIALSNLLKTPIHLHSGHNEHVIGAEHRRPDRSSIHLAFDETSSTFDAMIPN